MTRRIIAPTYFWPGTTGVPDGWSRVIMAAAYVSTVLLNPDSGPGQTQLQLFSDITRQSQAAGMKVLGYVDSGYGNRAIEDVLDDIDTYSDWYQVDGFFIDDMYILGKLWHCIQSVCLLLQVLDFVVDILQMMHSLTSISKYMTQ